MICPYGGNCIDPGNPSDCEVNRSCLNFSSAAERGEFDRLPDKYYFQDKLGRQKKFKTKNQLDFYLADLDLETKDGGESWGRL